MAPTKITGPKTTENSLTFDSERLTAAEYTQMQRLFRTCQTSIMPNGALLKCNAK